MLNEAKKSLDKGIGLIKMVRWEKIQDLVYIYKSCKTMFVNFLLNKLNINFETLFIFFISLDISLFIYSKRPRLRLIFLICHILFFNVYS